jgi:hypothetical protein
MWDTPNRCCSGMGRICNIAGYPKRWNFYLAWRQFIMCSDGKQCYRNIGNANGEVSLAPLSIPILQEKRRESNITLEDDFLSRYVR